MIKLIICGIVFFMLGRSIGTIRGINMAKKAQDEILENFKTSRLIEDLGYIDNPNEIAAGVPRTGIHMAKYLSRQAQKTEKGKRRLVRCPKCSLIFAAEKYPESNGKTRIEFHGIDEIPKK